MTTARPLTAWLLAAGLLLGGGGARAQLLSPGALTEPHAELEGDDRCEECHTAGRRVEGEKCLGCHDALHARVRAREGLHGDTYRGQACVECHVEHIGRGGRLIRWPGGDMRNFRHRLAGWRLRGEHREVECLRCHDRKRPSGRTTFLGLPTACRECHDDPHDGRLGRSCDGCHAESGWTRVDLDGFDHDLARFALRGRHRDVECEGCHGQPARYDLSFGTCEACHEDPHDGSFDPRPCDGCHSEEGWGRVGAFRSDHPGLSLRNGHRRVACERCHDRGNMRAPSAGRACVSCHEPVHRARFGRRCKRCHGSIRWLGLPERLGRRAHRRTRYPLRGRHRRVTCEGCHPKNMRPAKRYRGIAFDRCDRCHRDRHRGEFSDRNGGACGQCHDVRGFIPTTFGVKSHASTAFPLDGRHRAVPCGACHGERPRVDFRKSDRACADCHENPHGDQFAAEMEQGGCAHCHNTGGWRRPDVDHSTWPLTGAHETVACSACHTVSESERVTGDQRAYRGVPRACGRCHADPHAGQFRLSEPEKTCDACHDTSAFTIEGFDHQGHADWPLEGKHAALECASCHPETTIEGGERATRYRLGYRACKDCHANPHRE